MRLLSTFPRRLRGRAVALAAVGAVTAALAVVLPAGVAHAATACAVTYAKQWDNGSGFGANVTIRNLGDPLTGWTLRYAWAGNQRVTQGWIGIWSQPAGSNQVTVQNESYNANLATGASVIPGFNGFYSGANVDPTSFTLNGVACTGPNAPPTVAITAPAAGTHFTAPANVTVTATASDSDGTVSTVEFFRNGLLVGSDTTAPYTFVHSGLPAGSYALQARATDNGGATATAEVAIVVDPFVGPSLVVSPTTVTVPEGGTAPYTVRLSQQPPSSVVVTSTRTAGDTNITVAAGGSLTFTTASWNTPQAVTLAAAEDADQTAGQATVTVSATGYPSVAVTATESDNDQPVYVQRFLDQYNKLKTSGYFSPEGVPYHSIETLMVEAPDHGHETTSEAFSFWIWLEAQYGRVTGTWAPFNAAWAAMETYIIPTAAGQPGGSTSYNPADPADYAPEFPQPSSYPAPLSTSVIAGQDPLANELQTTYGNRLVYGMHWLLDVDNVYGFGNGSGECGDTTARVTYVNTYQRGPQESVWETVAHPSCETGRFGQPGSGFPPLFIAGSGSNQWRYTDAPDADARAIQAAYWALTWATAQGKASEVSATVAKAAKMGDYLRYSFFDKYFKNPGCTSTACPPGSGKSSSNYLLSWYYAWGGDIGGAWSWRIGSSHNHQGYQNPLAAYVLANVAALTPLSPTARADWQTSLTRQMEFYQWLQSAEGAFAGGATNSWNGNYSAPPAGTPTFYGLAYDPQPVYHDPPSNQWFGFQAWSIERVAEYYYVTGDAKAKTLLDKWVSWALANTTSSATAFTIPDTMAWTGAPATWNPASPAANTNLHVSVVKSTSSDVGTAAAYARLLTYYAARSGSTAAKSTAKNLLDALWAKQDAKGVGAPEVRDDYNRFDDVWTSANQTGLFIPSGYSGRMPNGDLIQPGSTFLGTRSFLRNDPDWPKVQAYLNGGAAPSFTYHRFWAQSDVAMAMADYGALFPAG